MDSNRLARHAGLTSIAVFLSRIMGLLRDQLFAYFFGATWAADAFNLAFIIPNLLRRLFGEGALAAAFVPIYQEMGIKKGRAAQIQFGLKVLTLLSGLLIALCIVGMALAPLLVSIMAPGFAKPTHDLAVTLTRVLFPYLFLIGLSSTLISILNAHNYFFVSGLSSAFLNVGMIAVLGAYVLLYPGRDLAEYALVLSIGVLVGGVMQTVVNWPQLHHVGYRMRLVADWHGEAMHSLWMRFLPGVLGIAVWQINAMVDRMLASTLPVGSISALNYGYRLMQLPLGIFGVALGTAAVPHFARCVSTGAIDELNRKLRFSYLSMLMLMVPLTALIAALGRSFLSILFLRGAFDQNALNMSYLALISYSAGLVFFCLIRVLVPIYYAYGDTRRPVRISIYTAVLNIALDIILMQFIGLAGLALGTSIAAAVQIFLLQTRMKRQFPQVTPGRLAVNSIKIVVLSMALYLVLSLLERVLPVQGLLPLIGRTAVLCVLWLALTFGGAMLLGVESSREVGRSLWRKIARR